MITTAAPQPLALRPYQADAVASVYDHLRTRDDNPCVVLPTGCHAQGHPILMHDGSIKPVEDVCVGDELMGPDSRPRRVLALCRGEDDLYRITPLRGEPFVVNGDHVLSLVCTNEGKGRFPSQRRGGEVENVTVLDYLQQSRWWRHLRKLYRVPIDFSQSRDLPVPPYILGLLIGDGCLRGITELTTADDELADSWERYAELVGCTVGVSGGVGRCATYVLQRGRGKFNIVRESLHALGLADRDSSTKFIPHEYLTATRHDRLQLLAGLIDSDGSASKSGIDYTTQSRELSADIVFLARSLGFWAGVMHKYSTCQTGAGGWFYRISIWGDFTDVPIRLPRRTPSERRTNKCPLRTGFHVAPAGRGRFYGFTLDDDHLYVDGHFVVHHNSGKTPVMTTICRDAVQQWDGRVLILAHVKELLEQAVDKLHAMAPDLWHQIGVYSAGLRSRDTDHAIIVAGIQSVYKRACELDRFDLILIDECHLIPPSGDGMYQQFLADAKVVNPNVRLVGLTATPYRMTSGTICSPPPDGLLNHVCYEIGVRELIVQGYLCPLKTKAGKRKADFGSLHLRGGEFIAGEVETLMDDDALVRSACAEIVGHTQNRNSVLIFAAGIQHAMHVQRVLKEMGHECGFVCGDTLPFERGETLERFKNGELKYLVNVNVLTTGFDAPNIDCVAMLRPTNSPGLYYQMVGRGFRLHPSKADCVAEGQRVLTDRGLVPIEQVTTDMLVWDGIRFVSHSGAVCQGEQEVISYGGITATPDHRMWTHEGWKTLWQCAIEQTAICVTGIDGAPVQESDRYFRGGRSRRSSWPTTSRCLVRHLWRAIAEVLHQPDAGHGGLSKMRPVAAGPQVARTASIGRQRSLHEHSQPAICRLRRTWDRIPVRHAHPNGGLDSRESGAASQSANRSNQQRRALRAGQPAVRHTETEYAQPPSTQRMRVWDILNAGPRHRFTCEGLLVSNCKILDFGGNVLRHGPVDALQAKDPNSGGGEAPAKECPQCQAIVHAAYATCPECGHVFPPPQREKHDATAHAGGIISGEVTETDYDVEDVYYTVHVKRDAPEGHPRTLRVDYRVGFNEHQAEWVCVEHPPGSYARQKAEAWWRARSAEPCPTDADEAVDLAHAGALAEVRSITVRSVAGEKYDRVVNYQLGSIPPRLDGSDEVESADLPDYAVINDEDIPF